jgi:hypothetical protein
MNMPRFTAEASFYATSGRYRSAGSNIVGRSGSVLAQSRFCSRLEQPCGGSKLLSGVVGVRHG